MFNIDDIVKINDTNLIGKVTRIRKNKNRNNIIYTINILSNNSNIVVDEKMISHYNLNTNEKRSKNSVNISYAFDNANFSNEIMLRHKTVEVALDNLEKFISQAICNKEKRIKIIHGRHGGILRKAVHEYLNNSPYIESYNLGEYYEGSYGVTIAYLK